MSLISHSLLIFDIFSFIPFLEYADKLMPDFFLDDQSPVQVSEQAKGGASGIANIFVNIQKQINPDLVKKVQGVYLFQVTGKLSFMGFSYWGYSSPSFY